MPVFQGVHLLFDLTLIMLTACLLLPARPRQPAHFGLIQLLLCMAALIISAEAALGLGGLLMPVATTVTHLVELVAAAIVNYRHTGQLPWDRIALIARHLLANSRDGLRKALISNRKPIPLHLALALGCIALFLLYAAINTAATPLNFDSNTYRLPRIAFWLQEHSIQHTATNDPRINYIPYFGELLMLWTTGHFNTGFITAGVPQLGGLLAMLLATWGWTSTLALQPLARWAALFLVMTLPNVALESLTTQTDLISGGLINCALLLAYCCLSPLAGLPSALLAGLAFGLAVGAKGTVLYWSPGIAIMFLLFGRIHGSPFLHTVRHGIAIGAVTALVGCLPFLQTTLTYGHPLGPESEYGYVHHTSDNGRDDGLITQLAAFGWQLLEPNSNPVQFEPMLHPVFEAGYNKLSTQVPPPGGDLSLLQMGKSIYDRLLPNEDAASFGILVPLVAFVGFSWGLWSPRQRPFAMIFLLGLAGFFLVFVNIQAWTPFKFRYFTMFAPPLALGAALLLDRGPRWLQEPVIALLALLLGSMAVSLAIRSEEHGLLTVLNPARSPLYLRWLDASQLTEQVGPQPQPVGISLPRNSWMAAFFRRVPGLRLDFVSNADLQSAGGPARYIASHNLSGLILPTLDMPETPAGLRIISGGYCSAFVVAPPIAGQPPVPCP